MVLLLKRPGYFQRHLLLHLSFGLIYNKRYLKNTPTTDKALRGGWFHNGDLAVWHVDGYIEIKDRSKDIIISSGENISSIEVEELINYCRENMEHFKAPKTIVFGALSKRLQVRFKNLNYGNKRMNFA